MIGCKISELATVEIPKPIIAASRISFIPYFLVPLSEIDEKKSG